MEYVILVMLSVVLGVLMGAVVGLFGWIIFEMVKYIKSIVPKRKRRKRK